MKTRQEIFNAAYIGLHGQGWKKSTDGAESSPACMYRGKNGLKCAIGHCIADEDYVPHLEGRFVRSEGVLCAAKIALGDQLFAGEMQRQHDLASSAAEMKTRFEAFAKQHNLTIPQVTA
jgi:hypothetical protein